MNDNRLTIQKPIDTQTIEDGYREHIENAKKVLLRIAELERLRLEMWKIK